MRLLRQYCHNIKTHFTWTQPVVCIAEFSNGSIFITIVGTCYERENKINFFNWKVQTNYYMKNVQKFMICKIFLKIAFTTMNLCQRKDWFTISVTMPVGWTDRLKYVNIAVYNAEYTIITIYRNPKIITNNLQTYYENRR